MASVNLTSTTTSVTSNITNSTTSFTQPLLPIPNGAYSLLALSAGLGCVGVCANGLALIVIFAFTAIWKKMNFFLLVNQIAVDFASSLFVAAQYLSIINGDPNTAFFNIRLTSDEACRWWYSKAWMWSFFLSSNYNVVFITFERYLKIIHPWTYHEHVTKVKARAALVVIWLVGPVYTLSTQVTTSNVSPDGRCQKAAIWPSVAAQSAYGAMTLVVQFFLPLIIIGFAYARLYAFIRRRRRAVGHQRTSSSSSATGIVVAPPSPHHQLARHASLATSIVGMFTKPREPPTASVAAAAATSAALQRASLSHIQMNILKTSIGVGLTFVFCWSWTSFSYVFTQFGLPQPSYYFSQFFVNMVMVSVCINPIIYTANLQEFQAGFVKMVDRIRYSLRLDARDKTISAIG